MKINVFFDLLKNVLLKILLQLNQDVFSLQFSLSSLPNVNIPHLRINILHQHLAQKSSRRQTNTVEV